ncbi:MAG TPA: M15 family metallopeptidase [Acidimicrobiales bacterium]
MTGTRRGARGHGQRPATPTGTTAARDERWPGPPAGNLRRVGALVTIAAAGLAGLVVGAAAVVGIQDAGSRPAPAPRATPATGPARSDAVGPAAASPDPGGSGPATAVPPAPTPSVLLAWTPQGLDPGLAVAADVDPAVTATSVVRGGPVDLVSSRDAGGAPVDGLASGWAIPLDALAIDPAAHAGFVSIADQAAVTALGEGEALLGATSAGLRRLEPGGVIELAGGRSLTVAAVVSDTAIGGAELAVDVATGEGLGVDTARYLLAAYAGDRAGLEQRLRAALTAGTAVRFRGPGETPFLRHGDAVLPQAQIKEQFGEFAYRPGSGGDAFVQDPAWQAANLTTVELPIVGAARCHRLVVDALAGALGDVVAANLGDLIDPEGFAGCWNPRTTRGSTSVSHHAWGVAVDINATANPTGLASVQDPRLLAIFARWGFTDGSDWLVPDAGHIEYVAPPGG